MKYTLLELVQRVLSSIGSDEVDSISDTEESMTVAEIIKECYFDIVGRHELPEHHDVFQLVASGDSSKPVLMTLPSRALDLQRLLYTTTDDANNTSLYDVNFVTFDEFIQYTGNLSEDADEVDSMTVQNSLGQSFTFKFMNDRPPTFYTTYNDRQIIFDSFDIVDSATLVGAKTLCYGNIEPEFELQDNYIPDIDAKQFQLLLQAAKSTASIEIRQVENPRSERKERRNEILAQKRKRAIDLRPERIKYRAYGRK